MSLQVWLPFNNNIKNQGVTGDVTQVTAPTYVDGKIGKAMSTGAVTIPAATAATFYNNKAMSFCFWIYTLANSSIGTPIIGQSAMAAGDNRMFSIYQYPTSADLYLSWQNEDSSGTFLGVQWLGYMPNNTWTHIAITYDGSVAKVYQNGVYKNSTSGTSARKNFSYNVPIPNCAYRYLNDLRIYDEVLSEKQIKEIAKGLVCHYPLDNNGSGMPNEIANSMPYTSVSGYSIAGTGWGAATLVNCDISPSGKAVRSTYNGDGGNSGGIHKQPYSYSSLENGEIYTFSLWIRASKSVPMNIYNEMMTSKTPAPPITIGTEWTFISVSGPVNTSAKYHSDIAYCTGANVTTGMWIEIFGLKLEKSNKATPWMPHTSDAEYSIFNINSNKEIDISGYSNHGTKSGTITYNSDTPRYSISTVFNGSNTFIACGRGGMVKDAITISSWVYADNWANINTIWSCTEGGGWSSGKDGSVYRFYMGTGTSSNTYKTVDAMTLSSITTGWHLITGTYDGFNVKIYIDGVLKGTNAAYTTKTPIFYASSNGIFIGAEAGGNQTTPAGSYTACKISDFRLYATALSADDIKQLYQVSASIDNNGNVFCSDIQEV